MRRGSRSAKVYDKDDIEEAARRKYGSVEAARTTTMLRRQRNRERKRSLMEAALSPTERAILLSTALARVGLRRTHVAAADEARCVDYVKGLTAASSDQVASSLSVDWPIGNETDVPAYAGLT